MAETGLSFKSLHSREYQGTFGGLELHGHQARIGVRSITLLASGPSILMWEVHSTSRTQWRKYNITYKPDGMHIAVGNRVDELTILDVRKFKPLHRRKFNYEVNELAWNTTGELFFLTTGNGTIEVLAYPSLKLLHTLMGHTAGCYCIAIDPTGRYFAVGSADSLVSLWDLKEMLCVRTFAKLSKSYVDTGRTVHQIPSTAAMNSVEWNPKYNLLAYAGDDKNKYQADEGVFRIFGFESA
ncbi:hypothetical protein QJS10_CPB15g01232 [Acorus calamus]|uniref:THO complex subunit 3 n=1 Tax=Acorus calamus TaxID=4465 RepID=A0AAV9D9B9_ACOCL|nr:hypothetical protein QJS10_CPB15g01232 [Acorus calamus]